MQYLLEGILSDVRIALDENEMTADLIRDINTLSLNDIIRQRSSMPFAPCRSTLRPI